MLAFKPALLLLSALSRCSIPSSFAATSPQYVLEDGKHFTRDVTLTFDDVPSADGLANISHYANLDFSSFSYFNASDAARTNLISSGDSNCAYSNPNALFAWRKNNPGLWPRFVLNATHATENGISPYFDLHGWAIKCMNNTPIYTTIFIQAWGIDFSDYSTPVIKKHYSLVTLNLKAGTQMQHPLDIAKVFPGWGQGVNMVEIWAVTQGGDDWPFCVDDIRVQFHEVEEDKEDETTDVLWSWKPVEKWGGGLELRAQRFV